MNGFQKTLATGILLSIHHPTGLTGSEVSDPLIQELVRSRQREKSQAKRIKVLMSEVRRLTKLVMFYQKKRKHENEFHEYQGEGEMGESKVVGY